MKVTTILRVFIALISIPTAITLAALPGVYVSSFLYRTFSTNMFLFSLVPVIFLSYVMFLMILCLLLSQFRKIVPLVPDGAYKKYSDDNIYYEVRGLFYSIFVEFLLIFRKTLNLPYIHRAFGAKIGKGTILSNKMLNPERVEIGENCIIGYQCVINAHLYENNNLMLKRIRIGNHSTVGAHVMIMPGVVIGDNCIIGANTVISKNKKVPSGTVWIGSKAKQLKKNV